MLHAGGGKQGFLEMGVVLEWGMKSVINSNIEPNTSI